MSNSDTDRAFEAAWKACSAWDGKITKPVLRKVIEAYIREIEGVASNSEDMESERCKAAIVEISKMPYYTMPLDEAKIDSLFKRYTKAVALADAALSWSAP